MNVADSEVVAAILQDRSYEPVENVAEADAIFLNTCSVRDNAEQRIWGRLDYFKSLKKKNKGLIVGVLGCMAERVGDELLDHPSVDLVAGPDAYRDLPFLIDKAQGGTEAINVELSEDETYDKITPVRIGDKTLSGFVSITRGCNNFCTYCIVPYTRGRERSRDPQDIVNEVRDLASKGYREVTLLGQNVNSYKWLPEGERKPVRFWDLLELVAAVDPLVRIRFTTSHPKDMSDKVLKAIAKHPNICGHIHLPLQSGEVLVAPRGLAAFEAQFEFAGQGVVPQHAGEDLFGQGHVGQHAPAAGERGGAAQFHFRAVLQKVAQAIGVVHANAQAQHQGVFAGFDGEGVEHELARRGGLRGRGLRQQEQGEQDEQDEGGGEAVDGGQGACAKRPGRCGPARLDAENAGEEVRRHSMSLSWMPAQGTTFSHSRAMMARR